MITTTKKDRKKRPFLVKCAIINKFYRFNNKGEVPFQHIVEAFIQEI
jgi:hypothetical protein